MRALLVPGLGPVPEDFLRREYAEQRHWHQVAETLLGKPVRADTLADHDVHSAVIVANALAACERYRALGGEIHGVAGYSVGQYAALALAGAITPEVALRLAVARARLMQAHARPGMGMLGVTGLSQAAVETLIAETTQGIEPSDARFLAVTNYNNARNITVGGSHDLLERFAEGALAAGAMQARLIVTEGAWHSRMLNPALAEFNSLVESVAIRAPVLPFADNATGRVESAPERLRRNLLAHLVSPVRWEASVRSLIAAGADSFLECGAGNLLTKFLFFIDRDKPCRPLHRLEDIRQCAASPA